MADRPTVAAVASQLDRIEAALGEQRKALKEVRGSTARIEEKADITNGRVTVIEHTLHGPIDRERRHLGGGLVHDVEEIRTQVDRNAAATSGMSAGQSGTRQAWQTVIAGASVLIAGLSLTAFVLGMILT